MKVLYDENFSERNNRHYPLYIINYTLSEAKSPTGLRKTKTVTGSKNTQLNGTITFHYSGDNVIMEEKGGSYLSRYTIGLGYIRRIDSRNNKYYYLYDSHGDVTVIADANGKVVKSYDYDIYGKEQDGGMDGQVFYNPIRYSGQFFDEESGLYYLRARYYSPAIMRFVSEDTYKGDIRNQLSLNYYLYCLSNPVMMYDPSGHRSISIRERIEKCIVTLGGGVGGIGGGIPFVRKKKLVKSPSSKNSASSTKSGYVIRGNIDLKKANNRVTKKAAINTSGIKVNKGASNSGKMTWNQFQSANKGKYTNAEMSAAWKQYKEANGIVSGVTRSQTAKSNFLKQLGESGKAPKWMNQWLSKGKVPPGYVVDHKIPLSIGGEDIPGNMRLLDESFHKLHHSKGFYRPWE